MTRHDTGGSRGQRTPGLALLAVTAVIALIAWLSLSGAARTGLGWLAAGLEWSGLLLIGANLAIVVAACLPSLLKRPDPLEPIYFMSFLFVLIFVFRPIQALYRPDIPASVMPSNPALLQKALLLGGLGSLFFYLGYYARLGERLARHLPVPVPRWDSARVIVIFVAYSVVGVSGFLYAVTRSGGFDLFWSTLQGRALLSDSQSMTYASTIFLLHSAVVLLGTYWLQWRRFLGLFLGGLATSLVLSTSLGGRSGVLIYALTLLVIFYYIRARHRRSITRLAGTLTSVLIVVAFVAVLGLLRGSVSTGLQDQALEGLTVTDYGDRFLAEFNQFDWFVVVLDLVPNTVPYQDGVTYLHYFAQFVPRALWPDKPLPFEYTITSLVLGSQSGSPFTAVGELYLNFGVMAIPIGMFLFGAICKTAYRFLWRDPGNPAVVLLYGFFFANLPHFYTRNFAPMMFNATLFLIPTGLALRFVSSRSASRPLDAAVVGQASQRLNAR